MVKGAPQGWMFVTNRAQVLVCIAPDPSIRQRDIGERVGITERAAPRIGVELAGAGYNAPTNRARQPLHDQRAAPGPDSIAQTQNVGELLAILTRPPTTNRQSGRTGTAA